MHPHISGVIPCPEQFHSCVSIKELPRPPTSLQSCKISDSEPCADQNTAVGVPILPIHDSIYASK